jgi:hypothetical protein
MNEIGEVDDQVVGIAAFSMLGLHFSERRRAVAAHDRRKEIDDAAPVGKAEHCTDPVGSDGGAAVGDRLVEQRERIAHRTLRGTGDHAQRLRLDGDLLSRRNPVEVGDHGRCVEPAEIEALAAGKDGDGNLSDLGRGEDELHMRRRLLEGLEQRVEGRLGEHVDFIDDVDLVAGDNRTVAHRLDELANIIDTGA